MEIDTKGNGHSIIEMEMGLYIMLKETNIKVNGKRMKNLEEEFNISLTGTNMMVIF